MQGICKVYNELKEEKEKVDIAIKIGVYTPSDNVEGVSRFCISYMSRIHPKTMSLSVSAHYEENFSEGAIGVLASMSFLLNDTAKDGTDKQYVSPLLQSFSRTVEDEKPAFSVGFIPEIV